MAVLTTCGRRRVNCQRAPEPQTHLGRPPAANAHGFFLALSERCYRSHALLTALATLRGILFSSSRPLQPPISSPLSSSRIPYINHTPLPTPLPSQSQWGDTLPSPPMEPPLLPAPPSQPTYGRTFRHWRAFLRSSPLRSGALFGALIFTSLVVYTTFLSAHGLPVWHRPSEWHGFSQHENPVSDPEHASPSSSLSEPITTTETSHPPPSPSPISDFLTVEQIRDYVAPSRGFFARDYSLGLGWNNVSVCGVPFLPY